MQLAASETGGAAALETEMLVAEQSSAGGGTWLLSRVVVQLGGFSDAVRSCWKCVSSLNFQGNTDKTDERLVAWQESIKISGVSPSANGERPAQFELTRRGLLQHFHRMITIIAIIILTKIVPIIMAGRLSLLGSLYISVG